ncbi:Hypothetical predicted protein [Pelobates cultripes]|uniref:Uncharacterized protein n=1 Tax=Pelobates cultripes TaxID=61616 RepID=A0AAD1QYS5_PELCU|nr:Hypothetical predicted protein [Pelobates cultripes]
MESNVDVVTLLGLLGCLFWDKFCRYTACLSPTKPIHPSLTLTYYEDHLKLTSGTETRHQT